MTFRDKIKEEELKTLSIDIFLENIGKFGSLDEALENLNERYLQFYSSNIKLLEKAIDSLFIQESFYTPERSGDTSWSKGEERKVKTIKYKGDLIHLIWEPDTGTWVAEVGFRSVISALKYGKVLQALADK